MKKGLKESKHLVKLSKNLVRTNLEDTEKKVEGIFLKLSKKLHPNKGNKLTLGQKTADGMTKWAGSWTFILSFIFFLILWMVLNTYYWLNYIGNKPFDPFPFILLNLILSTLAALQAPIILMSQNRSSQRDRIRTEYDYHVNIKAEKEIREIKSQLNRIEKKFK